MSVLVFVYISYMFCLILPENGLFKLRDLGDCMP